MFFENSQNTSLLKESLEKAYETKLTQDQALEAEQNFVGFFQLLHQIELTPFFKQSIPLKPMSGISHNF